MSHHDFTPSETDTDYVAIPLRRHDGTVIAWTLIDLVDFTPTISGYRWHLGPAGCACRMDRSKPGEDQTTVYLQREILRLPRRFDGREGDHKNRNRLDNRRSNLRPITPKENKENRTKQSGTSSRFRGVAWNNWNKKWAAYIYYDKRLRHLGYFLDEEEAARVAKEARAQHHPGALD